MSRCIVLLAFAWATVQAQDIQVFGVSKGATYFQWTAGPPPESEATYLFRAWVTGTASGSVVDGGVLPPNDIVPYGLEPGDGLRTLAYVADLYDSAAELDMDFPSGAYGIEVETGSAEWLELSVALEGSSYPPTPAFIDLSQLEGVDPNMDLTLDWAPFTGAAAQDSIQVMLSSLLTGEVLFLTPGPSEVGRLAGSPTSFLLPAAVLAPDSTYLVTVIFNRVVTSDNNQLSGATGLGLFFKSTTAMITTSAGGGDTDPPILVLSEPANGVEGVPGGAAIRFVFNEPMQPAVGIAWEPPLEAGAFTYEWSADERTLSCTPAQPLPPGVDFIWTLNPASEPQPFQDKAGNLLEPERYRGSFQTWHDGSGGVLEGDPPDLTLVFLGDPEVDPPVLRATSRNLRGFLLQSSADLIHWVTLATIESPLDTYDLPVVWPVAKPASFYRAVAYGITGEVSLEPGARVAEWVFPGGGVLRTTAHDGTLFSLTIPEGALLKPTRVSMTPVRTVVPSPVDQGLTAAVHLEPEGLMLWRAAELTVTTPGPIDSSNLIGFSYEADGLSVGYYPLSQVGEQELLFQLMHFSGYGAGRATPVKRDALPQGCDARRRAESRVADWFTQAAEKQRRGEDDSAEQTAVRQTMEDYYASSVFPNLEAAVEDETILDCAIHDYLTWASEMQLYGFTEETSFPQEIFAGIVNAIDKAQARCQQDSDLTAAPRMLELAALAAMLGFDDGSFSAEVMDRVRRCLQFKLQVFSDIAWAEDPLALSGRSYLRALEVNLQLADSMTHLEGAGELEYVNYEFADRFCDPLENLQGFGSQMRVLFGWITAKLRSSDCRCYRQESPTAPDEQENQKEIEVALLLEIGTPQESVYYPVTCTFGADQVVNSYHWVEAVDELHHEEIVEEFSQRPAEGCPTLVLQLDDFLTRGTDFAGRRKIAEKRFVRTVRIPEDELLPGVSYTEETVLEIFHAPSP